MGIVEQPLYKMPYEKWSSLESLLKVKARGKEKNTGEWGKAMKCPG